MRIQMSPLEARVIGCLLEKEITTPDQYPLSLSALTNACNQKSSRDPVMQLTELEVQDVIDGLMKKHLVSDRGGFGSRVTKYQHRFCNVGFGSLELSTQELGILCTLLLRGPQTPGELRTRTNRLCTFSDVQETEAVLQRLMQREDGPFTARLAREPGKRESRYTHLFGEESDTLSTDELAEDDLPLPKQSPHQRVEHLEALVQELEGRMDALTMRVEHLERGSQSDGE